MSTTPPPRGNVPPGTWIETPRQPKQNRCRQNLAHSKPKRTFFWIIEAEGPICQDCVNVRETRKAVEEGRMTRNNGKVESPGKSGKRPRSTKAPVVIGAVLEKRVHGASKAAIARDLRLSHNTVDRILEETEIDTRIAEGRSQALGLIPNAIEGVKLAMAKGDGSTSIRFLEGIGVLGEDKSRRGNAMASDPALQVAIQNLYLQQNHPGVHSPLINMPFVKAQTQSNSGEGVTVEAQTVEQKTDTSS